MRVLVPVPCHNIPEFCHCDYCLRSRREWEFVTGRRMIDPIQDEIDELADEILRKMGL